MKKFLTLLFLFVAFFGFAKNYNDGYIKYSPTKLSKADKTILRNIIENQNKSYDSNGKMLTSVIRAWNYHTDAMSGTFHQVRSSFTYAVSLLDLGDKKYKQRAFDVIEKTISLQDTNPKSPSCGVWPYYEEEPLATKKSPIDYNWADFNAVSLLEIYMGHKSELSEALQLKIKDALILAARSIEKRNMGPGYTNIAIMGTYVTYVTSHLFGLTDMQKYANDRLKRFYDYTLDKGGFSEYNSPTYTIVALDELNRMQRHIVEPTAKSMIDSLYNVGWTMIARHFHAPTAQWAGPHSRSYSTIVDKSFYGILYTATNGRFDLGVKPNRADVKTKHKLPANLYHYFLNPEYPRTENDVFEKVEPSVKGVTFMTDKYAISSANRSSLWNQRRPVLVYWGNTTKPHYLQPRLLHEFYDFSAGSIFTKQKENRILAAIGYDTNGGDKHISIDRLKNGKFKMKDLRLRFEIGNSTDVNSLVIPKSANDSFSFAVDGLNISLQLYYAAFDKYKGHWEKGSDQKNSWVDYVIYSGPEVEVDLKEIDNAALGFSLSVDDNNSESVNSMIQKGILRGSWNGLEVSVPLKPSKGMPYLLDKKE